MKLLLAFITLSFLFIGCSNPASRNAEELPPDQLLGGEDFGWEIYRGRYGKKGDYAPHYNHWNGYVVHSNEEIESLFVKKPDVEAIKFEFWDHDAEDFVLTKTIARFTNLKFLEIHSNRISSYPTEISNLTNLEELVIQCGNKDKIEFSFSNFVNLRHLTINFADKLKAIPETIYELKNLESLKLCYMHNLEDKELKGLDRLKKLKELFVWDSSVKLPNTDFNLPELQSLTLQWAQDTLPDAVWKQTSLKRLILRPVFAPVDFSQISKLKHLEELYLCQNTDYSGQLDLPALRHLTLYYLRDRRTFSFAEHNLPMLRSFTLWTSPHLQELTIDDRNRLRGIVVVDADSLHTINFVGRFDSLQDYVLKYNPRLKNYPNTVNGIAISDDASRK